MEGPRYGTYFLKEALNDKQGDHKLFSQLDNDCQC
jgi:hypothetical protein